MSIIVCNWHIENVIANVIKKYITLMISFRGKVKRTFSIHRNLMIEKIHSFENSKIAGLCCSVFLKLFIWQLVQFWMKFDSFFARLECDSKGWNCNEQCSKQYDNVHEFYQWQRGTKSRVNTDEIFKNQAFIRVWWTFANTLQKLWSGHMFIQILIRKKFIVF